MTAKRINVQFLFVPGCGNSGPALRRLRRVLAEEACGARVVVRRIRSDEEAARYGFRGSPTILIDGVDLEGPSVSRDRSRSTCRLYYWYDACLGVPDAQAIRAALRTHPAKRRRCARAPWSLQAISR